MEKPPQRYELIKSTPVDEDSFFFRAFLESKKAVADPILEQITPGVTIPRYRIEEAVSKQELRSIYG